MRQGLPKNLKATAEHQTIFTDKKNSYWQIGAIPGCIQKLAGSAGSFSLGLPGTTKVIFSFPEKEVVLFETIGVGKTFIVK